MSRGLVEAPLLSLAGFGSIGLLDWRVAVLIAAPSAITVATIDSVRVWVAGIGPSVHSPLTLS
jgi:hypothetical protein